MMTMHEVVDEAKVKALAADIEARGWQGAPLVCWGEQLITGTHRYAAVQQLGWLDSDIPTIELSEVFALAGLDLDAIHAEYGEPTSDEPIFVDMLLFELPDAIRAAYGIDLY